MKYYIKYSQNKSLIQNGRGVYVYIDKHHNPCGTAYNADKIVNNLLKTRTLLRMFNSFHNNDFYTKIYNI